MKIMKTITYVIAAVTLLFAVAGCDKTYLPGVEWYVSNTQIEMTVGSTQKILTGISEGDPETVFTFFSGNEEIATVDAEGMITGVASGTVTLLVYIEGEPEAVEVSVTVIPNAAANLQSIIEWAQAQVPEAASFNLTLPSEHPDLGGSIVWVSDDPTVITSAGVIFQKEFDTFANLTFTVTYEDRTGGATIPVTVPGYAPELVAGDFLKQFSRLITRSYDNIRITDSGYPEAVITWSSSDQSVFTDNGVYKKPAVDTEFTIQVTVSFPSRGITRTFEKSVTAQGTTIAEKADDIKSRFLAGQMVETVITESLELPLYDEKYAANLAWTSTKPLVLSSTGALTQPAQNQMITLRCTVTSGTQSTSFSIELEVAGKDYNEKWLAVEEFLDLIFLDEIKTQQYTMFGATSYTAYNEGYLPFYTNSQSVVLDGMVPFEDRPGIVKTETRWIVIHDTANTNSGATAEMHNRYIHSNPGVSWHYSVDNTEIYQHIPLNEVAWHAGEHDGNYYGIGIETCLQPGTDYNIVMRKTAKLSAELLNEFDLSLYNVRQHNYFSGKDCPHVMRASNRWNEFLNLTAIEYFAIKNLQGVDFVWESLTPEILDNTGKIISHPGTQTTVSYRVTVTYDSGSNVYEHTSTLLAKAW